MPSPVILMYTVFNLETLARKSGLKFLGMLIGCPLYILSHVINDKSIIYFESEDSTVKELTHFGTSEASAYF